MKSDHVEGLLRWAGGTTGRVRKGLPLSGERQARLSLADTATAWILLARSAQLDEIIAAARLSSMQT